MVAGSLWTAIHAARSSASRYPQRRRLMADAIRVALIDDDEAVLDSLRLYLERKRVLAFCFSTADAFIEKQQIGRFDCVVADVRMPGMSGLALVRQLDASGIDTPVILITGH